ncbi:hypothetical protein F5B22DRAFT_375244 [Xylaria bambusicola]|uniref:uncharacterized protein n=1 Tax=Xylaria bambusicola TaxID=326684 RepID=UPI002008946D|nr:uncharacterized protein F5B22DRAFT_375244 [Xylaria bambusicola]KAI0508973.1 hypothetical protein F5B22DRAFT_375244 [Xylaria bambusicola]
MGKPNKPDNSFSDTLSLHSDVGQSSAAIPYVDDDAPEINIDDLPPSYTDVAESSEAAPMLAHRGAMVDAVLPSDIDAMVITDKYWGTQSWVAKSVEDPETLEAYVHRLAEIPPRPYMSVVGTHTETSKDSKGKEAKNTVTDFDVTVDMTPYLYSDAQYRQSHRYLRTVDNGEKVRRGTTLAKRQKGWNQSIEVGADKPSLQEWCHRFGASSAGLKCFTLRRRMVGFDEEAVKERLEKMVRDTNYRGHLRVQLITKDGQIDFYNDAKINRWRLTSWIRWLFFLTLTFIFTWPYLFFRTKRWEVAVVDWPFSYINDRGAKCYVSVSEDQWYNMWGYAICRAVMDKRQKCLDQSDLRRAHEGDPAFNTGNAGVDGALGLFRAGMNAMGEVNRQLGWGGDC